MAKNSFHAYTLEKAYVAKEFNELAILARKRRDIHHRFFVHWHPYTDELIEKLNRGHARRELPANVKSTADANDVHGWRFY
jgi:hypothetical protein